MKVKRVFLKLNGEAFAGSRKTGFDKDTVKEVARQIKLPIDAGIQVGIVTDEDDSWKGRTDEVIDRTEADQIGMLTAVMNCIYVSEIFRNAGTMTQVPTPFACGFMTKLFSKGGANKYFERSTVVSFAGETGHPYFSTDTGVAFRTIGMEADYILLAKAIDGVYDSDPKLNPEAKKYDIIPMQKAIDKQLVVVDLTASIMYTEHKMPVVIFSLSEKNGTADAIQGWTSGTIVTA